MMIDSNPWLPVSVKPSHSCKIEYQDFATKQTFPALYNGWTKRFTSYDGLVELETKVMDCYKQVP
jgi:hypothetical protein